MPAASEVPRPEQLPRTWRPVGIRIAGIAGGALLFVFLGALWVLLSPEIREGFSLYQRGTLLLMGAGIVVGIHALCRARATATQVGLIVINGYRRRDLEWAEIIAIHMPPGAPWATLDLSDGETCSVMAVQSSDGARAKAAVKELRRLIG